MPSKVGDPVQECPFKKKNQPRDPKKKWIKFQVQDDKGKPLENVILRVILPGNSSEEVTTDKNGMVEIYNIDEGECKIDLDWKNITVFDAVHLK